MASENPDFTAAQEAGSSEGRTQDWRYCLPGLDRKHGGAAQALFYAIGFSESCRARGLTNWTIRCNCIPGTRHWPPIDGSPDDFDRD
ncbi:hypothetical protein [Sphingomonas colocasiae]|uniref:Uncharacterized protein n=1 Tax=Sphingomonas colocasiae TaxID=1848973 RepID=A0ABS7PSH8_9SPHN|nr:hypothetical protein [Sphingomonas colocasiae]MBY8824290.1 hypothetical protein [Sphingomonas colocasiae]